MTFCKFCFQDKRWRWWCDQKMYIKYVKKNVEQYQDLRYVFFVHKKLIDNFFHIFDIHFLITSPFKNFGISHKQSPKNCENVLYDHPLLKTLKSLKIGLETSNWYQIKALRELISKVASNLGPFIKEVRKFMDSPSKFEEIGDSLFDIY